MIHFLHTFHPQAILLSTNHITIYWYGLFMVLGIISAIITGIALTKYYKLSSSLIFDLAFYLVIGGIIGARIYDVILFLPYYIDKPIAIFKIWEGGLAIHGGIIAGLIIIFLFAKKHKINFWKLTSIIVPGVALGQAIGRWGNYFNQELFGLPTSLPWGIPINISNRPINYLNQQYFHPTFLYESLGNLIIFLILILITIYHIKRNKLNTSFFIVSSSLYMILYSILRFSLEYIRLDPEPVILNLRWPQIISLITIIIFLILILKANEKQKKQI